MPINSCDVGERHIQLVDYTENRLEFAANLLDLPAWELYFAWLENEEPDYIVFGNNRILRLIQLLTLLMPEKFKMSAQFVSPLAIPTKAKELTGQRVIILFDLVNDGTEFKRIYDRGKEYQPKSIKCLALCH